MTPRKAAAGDVVGEGAGTPGRARPLTTSPGESPGKTSVPSSRTRKISRSAALAEAGNVPWVQLGEFIEPLERRNTELKYGLEAVRGVSNTKEIMETRANMEDRVLDSFHVLLRNEFVFNRRTTRNGERLGLGFNDSGLTYIFTEDYVAFRVKSDCIELLDPSFLYLFFKRDEFDRYVRYHSWGSATEFFDWEDMCRVRIPLPSIEVQRKVVAAWKGLRKMKQDNEALAASLAALCQSRIQKLKKRWPMIEVGESLQQCNERNENGSFQVDAVRGISIDKKLIDTKADMTGVGLRPYKIVHPNDICFVTVTSRNGGKISLAINDTKNTVLVSSSYEVCRVSDASLLPDYLRLWFDRPEFDRYARFHSWGSARETFSFEAMRRVKIPLPPVAVQRSIAALYASANEARRIAEESDRTSTRICPALMRRVVLG